MTAALAILRKVMAAVGNKVRTLTLSPSEDKRFGGR